MAKLSSSMKENCGKLFRLNYAKKVNTCLVVTNVEQQNIIFNYANVKNPGTGDFIY